MFGKNKVATLVAEFLGTFALVSVVFAMVSRASFPFFAASAAAATLAIMVLVIGSVSGSHINPAVTVGLWSIKKVETTTALAYIAVQMAAGFTALRVNQWLMDYTLPGATSLGWDWKVVTAEAIGTFLFTFGIAAAVYKAYDGLQQAVAIGGALFVGILAASIGAAGALNPAVALGLNTWTVSYAVAPLIGAVLGMNLYARLFAEPVRSANHKKR